MGEFLILVSGIITQLCFMLFRALCPRHTQPVETERRDATLAMMSLAASRHFFAISAPSAAGMTKSMKRSLAR